MHPILVELGGVTLPAYGTALTLAFVAGTWLAVRRGENGGLSRSALVDVCLLGFVTSLVGARLLFALERPELFRAPPGRWLDLLDPFSASLGSGVAGLSMTGGVLLALGAGSALLRWRGLPVLPYADTIAPSVALGEAITRLGCFLSGCCSGTASTLPWAVRFPAGSEAARAIAGEAVHPTQLYASFAALSLFACLIAIARTAPRAGTVTAAWLVLASFVRALLDLLRYYPDEVIAWRVGPLSIATHVPVNLCLFAIGLVMWRAARAAPTPGIPR